MCQAAKVVLCIDDSILMLSTLQEALVADGFYVLLARNGEEGLAFVGNRPIDAIVVGLEMPIMSGVEVAKWAKARFPKMPVIMFSAASRPFQHNLPEIINHFVAKPNFSELVSIVRRFTTCD